MNNGYDDTTWEDAWDTDAVLSELESLSNRLMRAGVYEDCSLLLMVMKYITSKEESNEN